MSLLRGIVAIFLIICVTIAVCIPLFSMAIIALLLPGAAGRHWRRWMEVWLYAWTGFNKWLFHVMRISEIDVDWPQIDEMSTNKWYLVISNHRSWADILVLQTVLWNRVPQIKFFTKEQLIWIPFIGVGMYVLGFPYVKRATKDQIARNPDLKGADRDSIRSACTRFRFYPSTLLNFIEGTRFTHEKHGRQRNNYRNLLNPKIGGLSYVVAEMGTTLHRLIDITIIYPGGVPTFWEFLQGKCRRVLVYVDAPDLPARIRSERDEREQRRMLAQWIEERWRDKDERMTRVVGTIRAA